MTIRVDATKEFEKLLSHLNNLGRSVSNNINVGALRQASQVGRDALDKEQMTVKGVTKGTIYSRKNLKKKDIELKKKRRSSGGWERFVFSIVRDKYWYKMIAHSGYVEGKEGDPKPRYTQKGEHRGTLKRDNFIERAFYKSHKKMVKTYLLYFERRVGAKGGKIDLKKFKAELKGLA